MKGLTFLVGKVSLQKWYLSRMRKEASWQMRETQHSKWRKQCKAPKWNMREDQQASVAEMQ